MEDIFLTLNTFDSLQIVLLGFIGGVLSGFMGSGGAFFMTPGMMNLGVQGVIAVGSNITHKFGKAMVGSKRHGELGHVDKKLGIFMLSTALIGIRSAVWINSYLFSIGDKYADKGVAANLYISIVFIFVLSFVSISILKDIFKEKRSKGNGPSKRIPDLLSKFKIFPMIHFPVADVTVSLWIVLIVGLLTGYLAGTIGVGGFIGVPAMIYIFGIPTAVAAGTELFLAMFMGAFGAINYAFEGFVDIRLVILLYLGSLVGIYIGTYGTKYVKESVIRLVTGLIILLCVISRGIAVPIYLTQMELIDFIETSYLPVINNISKSFLYISGISGTLVIIFFVLKAYIRKNRVYATITNKY